jgi:hypothetical protein
VVTTTTTSTIPPRSAQVAEPPQLALPLPVPVGAAPPAGRNPVVIATAAVLVVLMGGAVGATGRRRLRY